MRYKFFRFLTLTAAASLVLGLWVAMPVSVSAAGGTLVEHLGAAGGQEGAGLQLKDPRITARKLIGYALGLTGILFLSLIVYSGFLWMTAGGNDEQVGKAKKFIFNSIIGLFLVVAAYGITSFVFTSGVNLSRKSCNSDRDCGANARCLGGNCLGERECLSNADCGGSMGGDLKCENGRCVLPGWGQ